MTVIYYVHAVNEREGTQLDAIVHNLVDARQFVYGGWWDRWTIEKDDDSGDHVMVEQYPVHPYRNRDPAKFENKKVEYDPGLSAEELCHCGEALIVQPSPASGWVANGPYIVCRECNNGHRIIRRLDDRINFQGQIISETPIF